MTGTYITSGPLLVITHCAMIKQLAIMSEQLDAAVTQWLVLGL